MDSTNNNDNQMFLCEFKELRKEISAMKKRIVQLEKSHEKQQERIDVLESENHALKTELFNIDGDNKDKSVLKRKRSDEVYEKETESKKPVSVSGSTCKKKTKTDNNNDDEAVMMPQRDNGDSFDSLSDDLLHKIVEFDGNCYSKFGLIKKRCKNIYDVKEYNLKKQTCVYGYGTLDMMLEYYLQKRREGSLDCLVMRYISEALIWYDRVDAIDWLIQLGDIRLLKWVCCIAAKHGRINILTKVFLNCSLAMIEELLNCTGLCFYSAWNGKLETLKWLRKYGARWSADTFDVARDYGYDEIVHYLRDEGCPETHSDTDESSENEQLGSDVEDGDNN